jgi:hypothetical protein
MHNHSAQRSHTDYLNNANNSRFVRARGLLHVDCCTAHVRRAQQRRQRHPDHMTATLRRSVPCGNDMWSHLAGSLQCRALRSASPRPLALPLTPHAGPGSAGAHRAGQPRRCAAAQPPPPRRPAPPAREQGGRRTGPAAPPSVAAAQTLGAPHTAPAAASPPQRSAAAGRKRVVRRTAL